MQDSAQARWTKLDTTREAVLQRARDCAELTLPYVLPRKGSDETTTLPTPYQSLGARAVNHLAARLLMALLPPANAFFRLSADPSALNELPPEAKTVVEKGLQEVENRLMRRIETGNLRPIIHGALKYLIVTGNALVHLPADNPAKMYRLDQYVVLRDPSNNVTDLLIREEVDPATLDEETVAACEIKVNDDNRKTVPVFTVVKHDYKTKRVKWHQEINDKEVPGSKGQRPVDETPFMVLRWQAAPGESYGRGAVEEYLGDFRSLEGLSKAVVQFAAACSKIIFMIKPGAVTDEDELIDAESGGFVTGRRDDLDILQIEKYADFQVAKATIDEITLRLSHAFLLQSGTVRNAERVTAEEIREMAEELESALGGVYTVLSQELQLPLVQRLIALLKHESDDFPGFKGDLVRPMIVTGFDALGRGHELNRFRAALADAAAVLGPEAVIERLNPNAVFEFLGTQHNVDFEVLLKSEEQLQAEREQAQEQQMAATMAEKAAGPVAGAVAKGMTQE